MCFVANLLLIKKKNHISWFAFDCQDCHFNSIRIYSIMWLRCGWQSLTCPLAHSISKWATILCVCALFSTVKSHRAILFSVCMEASSKKERKKKWANFPLHNRSKLLFSMKQKLRCECDSLFFVAFAVVGFHVCLYVYARLFFSLCFARCLRYVATFFFSVLTCTARLPDHKTAFSMHGKIKCYCAPFYVHSNHLKSAHKVTLTNSSRLLKQTYLTRTKQ